MLPVSRNRTYVDGTPVHPGDMNDLQDAAIDHETRLDAGEANITDLDGYTDRTRCVPLVPAMYLLDAGYNVPTDANIHATAATWIWWSQEHPTWGVRTDEKITEVHIRMLAIGPTANRTARLYEVLHATGVLSEIENWTFVGVAGAGTELFSHVLAAPPTVSPSRRYILAVEAPDSTDVLIAVHVSVDGMT